METIKIQYLNDEIERLRYIDGKSDWIDLRAAEEVELKAGEFKLIHLGVAMQLPEGYEAHIVPRSSTFKNFGIIQTNHCGIIDESYCGPNDWFYMPAYALRDTASDAERCGCCDGQRNRRQKGTAGNLSVEQSFDGPVSYTHLTLPTNREV